MRPAFPKSQDDLEAALFWWLLESGQDDPRAFLARLGLPGTRRRLLNHLRDRQLVAAAVIIAPEAGAYGQAIALRAACRKFAGHQWPIWQGFGAPPPHATEVAQVLFWAFLFDRGNTRDGYIHGPGDWSLSQFRKLLPPVHDSGQKSA